MSPHCSPPTPIEKLFGLLKSYIKFTSEVNNHITVTAVVRTGALVIEENGLFPITSKEWRFKVTYQQTMTKFKSHFRQVDKEYRREMTTVQAGYHAVSSVYQPDPLTIEQDMEPLALSNAPFMTTLAAFFTMVVEVSTLTSQVTNPIPAFTPVDFTAVVIAAVAAASSSGNNRNYTPDNNDNVIPAGYGYYWSHWYIPQHGAKPHNSSTYHNQKHVHKTEATVENKLGGEDAHVEVQRT